ncbi:hypothetical protein O9992_23535 [Vibrio lentus]|nr:hypothetical protein [Vibrio lentus]
MADLHVVSVWRTILQNGADDFMTLRKKLFRKRCVCWLWRANGSGD